MMEHKRRKNHGNGANERRNFAVMMEHETNFRERRNIKDGKVTEMVEVKDGIFRK